MGYGWDHHLPLTTRLTFPQRPQRQLVQRARLDRRLDESSQKPLTLISAPAGAGKTTLLYEWLSHSKRPGAWLSLEAGDNEPLRFWGACWTAIQQALAAGVQAEFPFGEAEAVSAASEELPASLLKWLSRLETEFILVLDDYQVIEDQEIHHALTYFVEHLPAPFQLVIATRADPPWPLARWRVSEQISELRGAELCFTLSETELFLKQSHELHLTPVEITALQRRTEGWAAGLQIVALSLRQAFTSSSQFIRTFRGTNRQVLRYLEDEVLHGLSEEIREFLLATSILERLQPALCNELTEQTQSETMLGQLESANLLEALDEEGCWYRYHPLLADLLQQQLQQRWPARVPLLQARASAWYAQQGLLSQAIEHALAAGEMLRAARLLERYVEAPGYQSEAPLSFAWLRRLDSAALLGEYPRLASLYATLRVRSVRLTPPDVGDGSQMMAKAGFIPQLPYQQRRQRWSDLESILFLGDLQREQGQLREALTLYQFVAQQGEEEVLWDYQRARLRQGEIYREWNQRGQAEAALRSVQQLNERLTPADIRSDCLLLGARLAWLDGYEQQAFSGLEQAEQDADYVGRIWINAFRLQYLETSTHKQLHPTYKSLESLMLSQDAPEVNERGAWLQVQARLLLREQPGEAIRLLESELQAPQRLERPGKQLELLVLLARAYQANDESGPALATLKQALRLAQPGGYQRIFLDEGAPMVQLLTTFQQEAQLEQEEVRAEADADLFNSIRLLLLNANPPYKDLSAPSAGSNRALPKGRERQRSAQMALSIRECEVLQLTAAGCSNRQIASALILAESTIKTHLNNIYAKLNVNSRLQAVTYAQELGLLGRVSETPARLTGRNAGDPQFFRVS